MKRQMVDALLQARKDKRPVAMLTRLDDGTQVLYEPDRPNPDIDASLVEAAEQVLRSDRSKSVKSDTGEVFVQAFNPPLRMIVIGAVHIAQSLAPMAALAGWQVSVIDPRISFATPERFPGVELHTQWPDEVLQSQQPDSRTAVVTLTHDPKLDDPALHVALRSPALYIGCLGSKRTHASRLERLRTAGFDDDALARIYGPLGLAIGARSPAEVALSALAQITACLRGSDLA